MTAEIKRIAYLIKDKTGLNFRVMQDGDFFSTIENEEPIILNTQVNGIYQDKMSNKTFFVFTRKGEHYLGYIDGISESEKSIANLIITLIEGESLKGESYKTTTLKDILLGECSDGQTQKFISKYGAQNKPCSIMYIYVACGDVGEIFDFIENFKENEYDLTTIIDDTTCVVVKFLSDELVESEYKSATSYAYTLINSMKEEIRASVKIGIGGVGRSFSKCAISFREARTAYITGCKFDENGEVYNYKDYIFVKMLEELPKYKLRDYLDVLIDDNSKSVLADSELVSTAEGFLNSSLNVSETSRKLYIHRNTLMYRLDKIERNTGLDVRNFPDALTFKFITTISKLLEENEDK